MSNSTALLALLAMLLSPLFGSAEVLRLEAVGAVPILGAGKQTSAPKQAAIQAALREAVSRVAHDLLIDADPSSLSEGPDPSKLAELLPVLGSDMLRYTTSFRILEDRGERPSLFVEDSGAATEYVVIVEVHVDAARVERRLVEAGQLASRGPRVAAGEIRLEVLGLSEYGAYQELRSLLIERLGARSVLPLELERGRSLLSVETELDPSVLVRRLIGVAPAYMRISRLQADAESIRLSVVWSPDSAEAAAAPGTDTRERRR